MYELNEIVASVRSDGCAMGVANFMQLEECGASEICEMHSTDKISQSAIGTLVRSKNKTLINPFLEGKELVEKAHAIGVYFSYGERVTNLSTIAKSMENSANITIKVDKNGTRISAVYRLFHSLLRMHRALKSYELQYDHDFEFENRWQFCLEAEAVLAVTSQCALLSQLETGFVAAYSYLINRKTQSSLDK